MSPEYRRASHTLFSLTVHICWITKYRYKVLKCPIGNRTKELIRRICNEENVEILSGAVAPDYVHMLVCIDPSIPISRLVKYLKGKTSRKLQMEFPELKKRYWGQHFWARGYFACTTGNVSNKMIEAYIEKHFEGTEGKDTFNVKEP
jgi:putative transposase